jgi:hypothetical protein
MSTKRFDMRDTAVGRLPRPGEPFHRVPLVRCERCGALHDVEPECCVCHDGIDDWDGAAAHYCGRCASLMGVSDPEHGQEKRIADLERKLSRVLDAAESMATRIPDTVLLTIIGYPERFQHFAEIDSPTRTEIEVHACQVDNNTRRSLGEHLVHEVRRKGDWSTLQAREKEIAELKDKLKQQKRRTAVMLDFVEQVVETECHAETDDLGELYPGSPIECHSLAAHRAAHRMGGRDALAEVLYAGNIRQRERSDVA